MRLSPTELKKMWFLSSLVNVLVTAPKLAHNLVSQAETCSILDLVRYNTAFVRREASHLDGHRNGDTLFIG